MLREADEIEKRMEVVGEEGTALEEILVYLKGHLYDFCYLQQNAFDEVDAYCPVERQVHMMEMMRAVFDIPMHFETREEIRLFFLHLQSDLRNLNYLPTDSSQYKQLKKSIEGKINDILRRQIKEASV